MATPSRDIDALRIAALRYVALLGELYLDVVGKSRGVILTAEFKAAHLLFLEGLDQGVATATRERLERGAVVESTFLELWSAVVPPLEYVLGDVDVFARALREPTRESVEAARAEAVRRVSLGVVGDTMIPQQREMLDHLIGKGARSESTRVSADAITGALWRRSSNGEDRKRLAELVRRGFLGSKKGTGGGFWVE